MTVAFIPFFVYAQKKDSLIQKDYRPTGIRLGTDVFSLVRNPIDNTFNGWEVSADVDFYRFFLTAELGQWGRDFSTEEENYSNSGSYWRVGVDMNFLKKDPEKNMFFLGARYGSGIFDETLSIQLNDTWNRGNSVYTNTDAKANWVEITGGLRVKVWKFLWLGYTARYKFALATKTTGNLIPTDVPGYGSTDKKHTWGFNYQVFIRFPIRKVQSVPLK